MPTRLPILAALVACALAAPVATASGAWLGPPAKAVGPCRADGSGPPCKIWTARVLSINDGDTIDVRFDGDRTRHDYAIRFLGVQAMEQTRYSNTPSKRRGQCHALQATNLVQRLIERGHRRVRLTAQTLHTDAIGRLWRTPAVRIGGHWVDLGEAEAKAGVVLWFPVHGETAWNTTYNPLVQAAARRGVGMFDTTRCGSGPAQDVPLKTWVMSDAIGNDPPEVDREYVRIKNQSATTPIDLGHWWVRDADLRRFTLPAGTVINPGHTLTLHVGAGQAAGESLYWGLPRPIFENTAAGDNIGDGAYLFDPQGDLRSWMIYPCLVGCTDPNTGAVRLIAHPRDPEYALIRNVSDRDVDLFGYQLRTFGNYDFGPDSLLRPGETMEIDVKGDPSNDSRLHKHLGIAKRYFWPDQGGAISLSTFDEITIACASWGDQRC